MKFRRTPPASLSLLVAALMVGPGFVVRAADEPSAARVHDAPETQPIPPNLAEGLAKARHADRDVLVVLNASDWGGWCARMREDFLGKPAFSAGAEKEFVVVQLDFPHNREKIPADTYRSNTAFAKKYRVTGFPVVLLLDKSGRAYSRMGYTPGTPESFLQRLSSLKKTRADRDALFTRARKNRGDLRAELFARALRTVDGSLAFEYAKEFEELRAADPGDRHGVLLDYDINLMFFRADDAARHEHNRSAGARECEAFLGDHPSLPPDKRQRVLLKRFGFLGVENAAGLTGDALAESRLAELKTILALAPDSASVPEIRRQVAAAEAALQKARTGTEK